MKIMIINGVNLNFLGIREKNIYGNKTYEDLKKDLYDFCEDKDVNLTILQSNIEGELVNFIQKAYFEKYDGIIINPGAYTHTSIALHDAIKSVSIPTIEVHISNIYSREDFRHKSMLAPACLGQISGFGLNSYILALYGLINNK